MREGPDDDFAPENLRAALRVSVASMVWTVLTSGSALVLGLTRGSLVLAAFGLTGLLDAAGSATLVVHFRHAMKHEAFSQRHERLALRVVTLGLVVVGLLTMGESVHRIIGRSRPHSVPAGVALAAMSAAVLTALSARKRRIGRHLPSPALVADGWLSAVGAALAVVTVGGTALTAAFDLRWADPAAALVIGCGALAAAVVLSHE